ncbi:hypothetical protein Q8F55_005071 [Vanrija albida]|uniref:Glycosyltransferase family 18 catalytic domain-containing protein n=1 Tax=Vanrija albida TaxID=181172 RepID=A0ABR3Q0M1_9TREE
MTTDIEQAPLTVWVTEPLWASEQRRRWRGRLPSPRATILMVFALAVFWVGFAAHYAPERVTSAKNTLVQWATPQPDHIVPAPAVEGPEVDKLIDEVSRIRVLKSVLHERFPAGAWEKYRANNYVSLDRLAACIMHGGCNESEMTVILAGSNHFGGSKAGQVSGEDIWAASSMEMFESLNHTILTAWDHWEALVMYQALSNRIPIVIMEASHYVKCAERSQGKGKPEDDDKHWHKLPYCMQSLKYPYGIPYWKVFQWHFWRGSNHALGNRWTMSPEDYAKMTGKEKEGYSLETRCRKEEHFQVRKHRAFAFGKPPTLFAEDENAFWEAMPKVRDAIKPEGDEKFDILSLSGNALPEGERKETLTPGIYTLGRQTQSNFTRFVAESKVMIGVGKPVLSPSPYDALCMGVPFINPIVRWDKKHPENKFAWELQQMGLRDVPEPYVYNVFAHDEEQLRRAVETAVNTPIERYIPPDMRFNTVLERHRAWVTNDWHAEAVETVKEKYKDRPEAEYASYIMYEQYMPDFPGPRVGEYVWKGEAKRWFGL